MAEDVIDLSPSQIVSEGYPIPDYPKWKFVGLENAKAHPLYGLLGGWLKVIYVLALVDLFLEAFCVGAIWKYTNLHPEIGDPIFLYLLFVTAIMLRMPFIALTPLLDRRMPHLVYIALWGASSSILPGSSPTARSSTCSSGSP